MPKKKAERKVNKRTSDISCTGGSPDSPGNQKKKRRTSNTPAQAQGPPSTPPSNDLGPPPLTGFGDTIIASNPFDDMPPSNMNAGPGHVPIPHPQMPPMQYMNNMGMKSMGMGGHMNNQMVCSMPPGMMGPNGPVGPGVPMNRGMAGPMGPLGGAMNTPMNGPGNSPMGGHIGPMSGLMNMNSMNNMGCSMPMNSSMANGGPGMTMNNLNSVNNMNGHMNNMSCNMNGPSGMNANQSMPNGPSPNMGQKPMPVSSGKIYPPDQPMVFNPQNPNAPPIYPCGMCHKEVHDNDQAILCESGCNFWFHRVCTGLTETAYHSLTSEVYAEWVCDKCLGSKSIPLVKFKP